MAIASIDDTGFHRSRLDEILALFVAEYQGIFGADIDIATETTEGQEIGTRSEVVSDLVSLAEAVYLARSPAGAIGSGLSRLVRLNGIVRKGAQYTNVTASLTGTPGTLVPEGSLAATTSTPPVVFQTMNDVTIGAGGTATVQMQTTTVGPLTAPAATLTVIQTVISGWDTVTNGSDATPGRLAETDQELRIRRAVSVAGPSQGITDGLWGAILQLTGVLDARVFENFTDTANGLGMPRHSIWAVVDGGDPADIAGVMWLRKSQGCTLVGTVVQNVTDSQGQAQVMRFDRPTDVPIYVTVTVTAALSSDVAAAIKAAIVAYGQSTYKIGKAVQWFKLSVPITTTAPDADVVSVFLGTSASPTLEADVPIGPTQVSRWDVSRIVVGT